MWDVPAVERPFLRGLARDIVADIADDELEAFDTLVERYFANPVPPTVPQRYSGGPRTIAASPRFSEVTPGVLLAVINFLVICLEEAPQRPPADDIRAGLRRLLWSGRQGQHEGVRVKPASALHPQRLMVLVFCYTQPVSASVASEELREIALSTGQIYGLSEAQAALLSNAVITRICRNIKA
jgi:hypothetical protein